MTDEQRKELQESNAPFFEVSLKDTSIIENTFLTFMVKVKGSPNPKVRFTKDDKEIMDFDKHIKINRDHEETGFYEVLIPDFNANDAGVYLCTAYNQFGTAKSEATVTIVTEKDIFGDLGDTPVVEGEEPIFHWKKDGEPFDPEERFKVLMGDSEDSLALVFQHVKPEDAGLYTCVAHTMQGNISCSAELTVQGTVNELPKDPCKPRLYIDTKEALANVGSSAMMELKVDGFPKPDIKWSFKGKPIEPGGRYRFLFEDSETMTLIIKGVTMEDAGVYSVHAQNDLGEDSIDLRLIVRCAPKIITPGSITCPAGEAFKMSIEITGNPEPTAKFFHNGQEIVENDRIKFHRAGEYYLIKFNETILSDSGNYSVSTNLYSREANFEY